VTVVVLPDPSLVLLVGAAASGKSTFAARHFEPDEILSSDAFRAAISGDAADQSVTRAAFRALHAALDRRLRADLLSVVDATNLTRGARQAVVDRATAAGIRSTAIVLDLPAEIVLARNAARPDRVVPQDVVHRHLHQIRRILDDAALARDGFERILVLRDPVEANGLEIRRMPRE
jgi:protein phosphatase